jgi:hypothetical protein
MSSQPQNLNRTEVSPRILWLGFFSAGFAFALEGFVGWVISSRACYIGHGALGPISPGGLRWLLVGITVVLFGVSLNGGLLSYRNWRRLTGTSKLMDSEAEEANEFIALLGFLMSGFLTVGIFWMSLLFIFLSVCMREH